MSLALKCVTQWVWICVDMSETPSDNYQWPALVTPHWSPHIITKFNIVRTTLYYITEHVVLLVDTLQCPRWNNHVILVTRHVLFCSSILSIFLWHNNFSHVSGQTMTNTIIIERDPREYLLHRQSSNSHNYIMQHIGVPSGKSKDHLYSYPVTDITFDNLVTSILYPSVQMSCGANELVTVILWHMMKYR